MERFCVPEEKQCACVYVRERESRDTRCRHREYASGNVYSQRRKTQYITKWEEGALYSHPRSSLTIKLMEHGE